MFSVTETSAKLIGMQLYIETTSARAIRPQTRASILVLTN